MRYRYQAVDAQGSPLAGTCDADSEAAARQQLRDSGLTPLSLDTTGSGWREAFGRQRWSRAERVLFIRQLAALLQAGMPLENALAAVAEQAERPATQAVIAEMRQSIGAGLALSAAMGEQAQAFDTLTCALVRIAEKSGHLAPVLADLADHLESADSFRQRATVAMIYPAAILVVALLVIGALLVHVMPQIVEVFVRQQQTLPWLTRALIVVSEFLRAIFWPALVGLVAGAVLLRRTWNQPEGRATLLAALGRLPLLGGLLRMAGTYRLAAALGVALKGGVPLVPALSLCRQVLALPAQRAAVERLAEAVGRGASFTAALTGSRDAPIRSFSPRLKHYVALGEQNGRLADMLAQVAKQERNALEYRLGWLAGLLEPVLVLVMGGVVLTIVLAVLLPIIEVNQFF